METTITSDVNETFTHIDNCLRSFSKDELGHKLYEEFQQLASGQDNSLENIFNEASIKDILIFLNNILPLWNNLQQEQDTEEKEAYIARIQILLVYPLHIKSKWGEFKGLISHTFSDIALKYHGIFEEEDLLKEKALLLEENQALIDTQLLLFMDKGQALYDQIYQIIVSTLFMNETNSSGLIEEGQTYKIEDLKKINKKVARHALKTSFNHVCNSIFLEERENFDEMMMFSQIDSKHFLCEAMDLKLEEDQIAYAYISAESIAKPIIPRFANIVDRKTGNPFSPVQLYHTDIRQTIPCHLTGKEVFLDTHFYVGILLAEAGDIKEENTNIVDISKLLQDARSKIVKNPKFKNYSKEDPEGDSFAEEYMNIYKTLADKNDKEWDSIVNK